MTRSTHNHNSRRTTFYKHVRQKAHQEGIPFRTALAHTLTPPGIKVLYSSHIERRNPGRADGVQWNSDACISWSKVDDGELFIREEDVYDSRVDFVDTRDAPHDTDMTVSLLDIARPAKRKGVAKDFEIVQKTRNVIALEDDLESLGYQWEEDEWEQIHDERHTEEPRSYSSVLRGNET